MKLKDILYIALIGLLLVLVLTSPRYIKDVNDKNKDLLDSIAAQQKVIIELTELQKIDSIQIDSLKNVRAVVKIKYKTIYEEYKTKDSLVNSLSVDSIIHLWAKRYNLSKAQ